MNLCWRSVHKAHSSCVFRLLLFKGNMHFAQLHMLLPLLHRRQSGSEHTLTIWYTILRKHGQVKKLTCICWLSRYMCKQTNKNLCPTLGNVCCPTIVSANESCSKKERRWRDGRENTLTMVIMITMVTIFIIIISCYCWSDSGRGNKVSTYFNIFIYAGWAMSFHT